MLRLRHRTTCLQLWCLLSLAGACESIDDDDCETASVLLLQISADLGRVSVDRPGGPALTPKQGSHEAEDATANLSFAATAPAGGPGNSSSVVPAEAVGVHLTPVLELLMGSSVGSDRVRSHTMIMLSLVLLLVAAVMGFSFLGMTALGSNDLTACALPGDAKLENQEKYFKVALNDLINILGIPAFSVLDMSASGLTGLPRRVTIFLLAAQSWLLQGAVLCLLWNGMVTKTYTTPPMSRFAITVASYLNIINVLSDLPVAFLLLRYLSHFHPNSTRADYMFAYIVCFIGAIIVPCSAVVVGGLWFTTATDYVDLMLKIAVFKFITQIDTWIVAVNSRTNLLAGAVAPLMINLPSDPSFAKLLNYAFVVVPVFPAAVSMILAGVGTMLRGS